MEVLALVPARGGSKSIPRKNLVELDGRPLLVYTLEHALAVEEITRTIVSTDDNEIAEVARSCGAEVPFMRPAEHAQDDSLDIEVFRHCLQWLRDQEGYEPELVVHLRPTNPLRPQQLTGKAIAEMIAHPEADSLRSVSIAEQSPYKMWQIVDSKLVPLVGIAGMAEPYSMPRQRLPLVYWQNGVVDIVRPRTILEQESMAGRNVHPFIVRYRHR